MSDSRHIFFIQEHLQETAFHGSIGYVDAERILQRQGAIPILFPYHHDFSVKAKIVRLWYLVRCIFCLPNHAIVLFQYPLYATMNKWLIRALRFRKKITVICFIGDINGLKYGNASLLKKEIRLFRQFKYFIVHNPAMLQWLQQQVPQSRAGMIRFFDFMATPFQGHHTKTMTIVFAGNLSKSPFIEKLPAVVAGNELVFHIYGPSASEDTTWNKQIVYKGVHEPYVLPQLVEGSFGLVWDGEGVEGPEGSLGHYMSYITHHKVSLYILSGLPLIVYEKAGAAELVKKYGIGITISSLHEIHDKLKVLSEADYRTMCNNTRSLASGITAGTGLMRALETVMDGIPLH